MGDYNRNDRGGDRGGRRFGPRDSGGRSYGGGGRDFGRPAMHRATCAECGNSCEVPFMPSGDRPVYCSNCFESRRNQDGDSRGTSGRNFNRPNYEEKRSYSAPSGDNSRSRGGDSGQLMDQLKSLHFKLDKIIGFLEPKTTNPTVANKVATEKIVKPKVPKIEATDIVFEPKAVKPAAAKKKVIEVKV